jgi:MFS transporter, PPP family, 3-phenylpropionic acid transporter
MIGPDAKKEARALAGAYALYFGAAGVTLPFLPAYFASLGVEPSRVGLLLALGPGLSLVAPSRWGRWADRRGRPDLALRAAAFGAAACFAGLLPARSFGQVLAAMLGYGLFVTSIIPLLDSLTIECVRRSGGSYGRIRLVGSLAFAASSALFGRLGGPGREAVVVPLVALSALAAWTLFVVPAPPGRPNAPAGRPPKLPRSGDASTTPRAPEGSNESSLRQPLLPLLAPFLGACILHWVALSPFHGNLALHVAALGLPFNVVGTCSSLGVLAEVAVMAVSAPLLGRLGAVRVLRLALAAGVLRWGLMAVVRSVPALLAVSLLHGLTFGAFYVAAVAFVSERVPPERRASGQGLFAAATFGVGGIAGYTLSGAGFQALGGPRLFAVASVVDLLALGLTLRLVELSRGASKKDASLLTVRQGARLARRNGDETMARKRTITTVLLLSAVPTTLAVAAAAQNERLAPSIEASERPAPSIEASERPAPNAEPLSQKEPPPDEKAPLALIKLRGELLSTGREKAQEKPGYFRPLCDRDGYPLVGNMASKGPVYQPSEFCADVRKAAK